ncbi:hypothetical protein HK098_002897 [Nowakowskiella sp. JEL0407]|nr:hypothetical protein HK098_002897 [Nowakowskiella sp. JEL0407]
MSQTESKAAYPSADTLEGSSSSEPARPSRVEAVMEATVNTIQASVYPMLGVGFFTTHPSLWLSILCHLVTATLISTAISILCFIFFLPLQATALISVKCPAWAAWLVSVLFTLIESIVVNLIFALIYFPMIMDGVFDKTLSLRGLEETVKKAQKQARRNCSQNASRCLHPIIFGLTTLLALPLLLIPIVGWYLFFMLNGYFVAWGCHLHYFDLKLLTYRESRAYLHANWSSYWTFGMAAGGLQMLPFVGIFFMFTNTVGAALWAADLEESGRSPKIVLENGEILGEVNPLLNAGPGKNQVWSLNQREIV